ncbi:tetratricopeptide repeat protein [Mesorhizobium sp. UC74_2]|uniref:tetratricopeptide repeat protein n=1 Tax=Mesorhizobium sp. UC74_2 TaxID=3350171 RepID=UPI00366CD6A3
MKSDRSSRALSEILRDLAGEESGLAEALRLAEAHLAGEPGDTEILEWRIRLLEQMGRGEEAMTAFEPYKAAILARQPESPHRWQELGFALYWQAGICRDLGRREEARRLVLEAVTRIGSFADHTAWMTAARWFWEDGEFDGAGRLWYDVMFRSNADVGLATEILKTTTALGDEHSHDWVWLARMRATLTVPAQRRERIEAMFRRVEHQPLAWRIRARARAMADDLDGASVDLDRYLEFGGDPRAQLWRAQLNHLMGRAHGLEQIVWKRTSEAGARDYYAAGCDVAEFIEELQQEGEYVGADDFARARRVEAEVYKLGAERFEHYFRTGDGNSEDADPHVYAMLCNNLGSSWGINQERYLEGIAWHDKGWAVSPFWEQYSNRLRNQLHARQWAGVIESYDVLRRSFGTNWGYEKRLNGVGYAYDQLGRHGDVVALYDEFADWCWAFETGRLEFDEEENQIGLVLRAAKAAAHQGRDDLLRDITERLLASDRLTPNMAEFLATVWTDHGDQAEAERCRQALIPQEPPAMSDAARLPDLETLQGIHDGLLLNSGYGALTLAAEDERDWHFVVTRYLAPANGDAFCPVNIEAQRGPEPGGRAWQVGQVEERAGWLGRLGGRKVDRRVQLTRSTTGSLDADALQNADEAEIAAFWPQFLQRYDRAGKIWQQLSATITIEHVRALLAELEAAGHGYGQSLDLGMCMIQRSLINGRQEISLCFDRLRDGDPARPGKACDFYYYRYQIAGTEGEPVLCYMYQDKNHQAARDIEPGDPDLALASLDHFRRMTRRLEGWRRQRNG